MTEPLDLAQLRSLVAVATCGGVGRAATSLQLSQPAVSQHVRSLERRLQRALIVRDGRRARLTAAGEQLVTEARRLLDAHDEALARLGATPGRPLALGCADSVAGHALPGILGAMQDAWPGRRQVRLTIERSADLVDAVARGTVDLAVVVVASSELPGRVVGYLPLRWYAAPGLTLDDHVPLVAYTAPCGIRSRALVDLADAGLHADVTAESSGLDGLVAAARAGLGVVALPTPAPPAAGLVERTDLPGLGVAAVHLVTRRGLDADTESAALGALERALRTPGGADDG